MPDTPPEHSTRQLYVGYLPTPRRHIRTLRLATGAILWLCVAVAATIAWQMRDPGAGVWNTAEQVALEGTIVMRPYPLLLLDRDNQDATGARTLVLVELGKRASMRAADHDGNRVRVSGWLLERDGRRLLELAPDDIIHVEKASSIESTVTLGQVTAQGEIVDYKCYLGAMKPGDGVGHRACATLCVRGGIPPVLITQSANGTPMHYILINNDGSAFNEQAAPFIARPVEITGQAERLGDLNLLRVNPQGLTSIR